jgi:hypothetical protein
MAQSSQQTLQPSAHQPVLLVITELLTAQQDVGPTAQQTSQVEYSHSIPLHGH